MVKQQKNSGRAITCRELAQAARAVERASLAVDGDPRLRASLAALAEALEAGGKNVVDDLLVVIRSISRTSTRQVSRDPSATQGTEPTPNEKILRLLDDPETPKEDLIRIGIVRFGLSLGTAQRMSRSNLVDRLRDMLGDEARHDVIARLARGPQQAALFVHDEEVTTERLVDILEPLTQARISVLALNDNWPGLAQAVRERVSPDVFSTLADGVLKVEGSRKEIVERCARTLAQLLKYQRRETVK